MNNDSYLDASDINSLDTEEETINNIRVEFKKQVNDIIEKNNHIHEKLFDRAVYLINNSYLKYKDRKITEKNLSGEIRFTKDKHNIVFTETEYSINYILPIDVILSYNAAVECKFYEYIEALNNYNDYTNAQMYLKTTKESYEYNLHQYEALKKKYESYYKETLEKSPWYNSLITKESMMNNNLYVKFKNEN